MSDATKNPTTTPTNIADFTKAKALRDAQKQAEEASKGGDPHWAGPVKCTACKHEWYGVAPMGRVVVECPECSLMRGMPNYPFGPDPKHPILTCVHCSCDSMVAWHDGGYPRLMCSGCGCDQTESFYAP